MKRWHQEKTVMARELKRRAALHRHGHFNVEKVPPLPKWARQAGRFRKTDAYDCGKPGCCICHFEKRYDRPDIKRIRDRLSYREQVAEVPA